MYRGDANIRIQTYVITLLAIVISFIGLAPTTLCMPRLIFRIPPVKFILCPDVNGDGLVNIGDLLIVGRSFGISRGSVGWDPKADVSPDGVIDILDVVQIATFVSSPV